MCPVVCARTAWWCPICRCNSAHCQWPHLVAHRWPSSVTFGGPAVAATGTPLLACPASQRWPNENQSLMSHCWPKGGPLVAIRGLPMGGPPVGQQWLIFVGPTLAGRTRQQWRAGGCHRWSTECDAAGPPMGHQVYAIWVIGGAVTALRVTESFRCIG